MIIYTPLSKEDIFYTSQEYTERQMISYNGKPLYCEKRADGSLEIVKLLSTDPKDFLNHEFSPGTIISQMNEN
ncbi:hypothetical protein CAI16_01280 [Virgibacillus dokdonensis]|uniref:YlzJ-like protein n=2 Tax=Virgibacillus TaxID=84406 RepID=A0A1M5N3H3_9BACI|nr:MULTISPECIES: YlzJ-like family protein [Virgibacillus]RFA37762.1 hypothetical protein CAI16_01280 [Virgibacillus dokdonensis]SHG83997.1 YlzJ-like protein [Virgibacillus chiguensis]